MSSPGSAKVMGILNVTPDSFFDGGRYREPPDAVAHGLAMVDQGAAVIDVGGESTRPGAEPVEPVEEMGRILPVIEALASADVTVSVDTRHAAVAKAAVAAGASIINDVSGELGEVAARAGAGWICMHMKGDPRTMQEEPRYGDVVAEVESYLGERAAAGATAGAEPVWIDPGIGFGKSLEHNLELLGSLRRFTAGTWPVVVGVSRKSMLGVLAARAAGSDKALSASERLEGSLVAAVWAMLAGVDMVRVHDVGPTVDALGIVAD